QRIHDLAGRLGLDVDAILARQFVRLSGGMKQKLLIAIALGREAQVLVMDEPAANLDPEARKIFFDLLAERLDNGTIIISSHRLDEVSALVNRVIEMDMGKIVLDDKVADAVSLTATLACRIVLGRFEPAFAKALAGWIFTARTTTGSGTARSPGRTACASSASCRAIRRWSATCRWPRPDHVRHPAPPAARPPRPRRPAADPARRRPLGLQEGLLAG